MKRTSSALLALALTGSLVACSDDGDDGGTGQVAATAGTSTSPSPSAGQTAQVEPSASASPSAGPVETEQPAQAPFPANTAVDTEEPSGGPLSVTAVRVAPQEGYDRVVFELDGQSAGQPGWRVEYVDEPTAQGSGDSVEVAGDAALSVTITGTGYPFDTGVEEVEGDPALPGGLQVVEDVVLGGVYEGQYDAFIGTSGRAPFRVFRLDDPARVVVDVRTDQAAG